MRKETITLDAVRQDFFRIVNFQISNKKEWRLSYIIPASILAVAAGMFFASIFVGLLVFSIAAYHIVRYVIEYKEYKKNQNAVMSLIFRGDFSISHVVFSHATDEIIYEPHRINIRRTKSTKIVKIFYFNGGISWRLPQVDNHYLWSKEMYISSKGLENISVGGDEFYFISLQGYPDIAYVYPCKMFDIDESIK